MYSSNMAKVMMPRPGYIFPLTLLSADTTSSNRFQSTARCDKISVPCVTLLPMHSALARETHDFFDGLDDVALVDSIWVLALLAPR